MSARARDLTVEKAAEVSRLLAADHLLSTDAAAMRVGVSVNAVRAALSRFRAGKSTPEEEEVIEPIALAIEGQCAEMIRLGMEAAKKDQKTGFYQFMLEKKHPLAFGRESTLKVEGNGDAPLAVVILPANGREPASE